MSTATHDPDEPEVLDPDEVLHDLAGRTPVIDRLQDRQRELLFRKLGMAEAEGHPGRWVGPNGLSMADVAGMLEIAGMYGLDPFAPGEIWVSRGKPKDGPGKLMVMVGRDGLRKVAIRNGLEIDGDVVRERDAFTVTRAADRSRTIEHEYGASTDGGRGPIVGAWAEVYERRTRRQRGYFYAPLEEYLPDSPGWGSPWKAQVSAMIRKSAERQAISQATPLGGLMVDGEADVNLQDLERGSVLGTDRALAPAPEEAFAALPWAAQEVVARARELGHVGLSDVGAVQMVLDGADQPGVGAWVLASMLELDHFENQKLSAEAMGADMPDGAGTSVPGAEPDGPEPGPDAEALADERARLEAMMDAATERGDEPEVEELRLQLDGLEGGE
jgi:hypothetical protein